MTNYREATSDFVNSAKGVGGAVDLLKAAMAGGDPDDISFATDLVAGAADSYMGKTATYQQSGFDEIAASPHEALLQRERLASDLLAGTLVDLDVANAIMAVALAAKQPNPASIGELEMSSERLNTVVGVVALPLGRSVEVPVQTARFGWDEVPAAVTLAPTLNQAAAKGVYEKQVADVFSALVTESKKVVLTTFESIQGLDFEKLLATMGSVGKLASQLPQVSKLAAKALAIVVQAMEKMSALLGITNQGEAIWAVARKIREYTQDPTKPLEELLELSYRAAEAKNHISELLKKTSAAASHIDEGAKELVQLGTRFSEQMTFLVQIVGGVTIAKRLVNFFTPEATTILFFGSFYVLAMSYAVLAGMDFADSAGSLNLVHGVIRISEAVLI